MRTKHFNILIIVLILVFTASCGKKSDDTAEDMVNYDSVYTLYNTVKFKSDSSWENMISEDENKFDLMNQLITKMEENGLGAEKAEELKNNLKDLKDLQYSREELKSSEKIDEYDSATDAFTMKLFEAADEINLEEKSENSEALMDSIEAANNNRLMLRIDHDVHTKVYNEIVIAYPDSIAGIENGSQPEERGVFTIPTE
ncbi:hypothetical protein OO013_13965 [Mangrovivirga sp. M17]|uniref:OmpH family outer membrane protein n=1 Tax=Mangrovivirga halotolerans TaxID=2993936 RepID=A0ABT3RUF2_9BACT|nr:hypothetical protein [Mangrovivirga halotolerans]MCX2744984.1 hypothetical protein [Mangrovivirga halotolerans]